MDITEGNRLIAEFMGLMPNPSDGGKTYGVNAFKHENGDVLADSWEIPLYHCSWDWLMPVVFKIIDTGFYFFWEGYVIRFCRFSDGSGVLSRSAFLKNIEGKEAIWIAVVDFIQWYNNQK